MLQKRIGKRALFLLTINAVLGTGIFFLPAVGYAQSGAASLFAWVGMSIIAILMSVYFAELISLYPKSGGVYEYAKHAFGEFTSFIVGWVAWLVANITIAMLIVGSLLYIFPEANIIFNIAASLLMILVFNYISYRGISLSAAVMTIFGIITLAILLAIIFPGALSINPVNFVPFAAPLPLLLLTVYIVSETFFGWETASYLSEEIKDARKVLPKMLVIATAFIALLAIALVTVSIGVAGPALANHPAPLVLVASSIFGEYSSIFALIIFIPLIGTAASWIISSPRLLYAMSRDRVISKRLHKVHPKYKTPHYAIAFQSIVTAAITIIGFADYITLLQLLVPLVIVMYTFVLLSVIKLRIHKPNLKRGFSAPFAKELPLLIIIALLYLLYIWAAENSYTLLVLDMFLIIFGIPLYFLIKMNDRSFVEKFFNRFSPFMDKTLPIWYSKKDVTKVIRKLKLKRDSIVLDFGAGTGYTTTAIAKHAPDGLTIAVDISEKQLERAIKRAREKREHNIIFLKEHELCFEKRTFDAVTGVGVLEYLDNPKRTINTLMSLLRKGGRFCFLSFGRSLMIPAPEHLANKEAIKTLFPDNAKLHIERKRKNITDIWIIWGERR